MAVAKPKPVRSPKASVLPRLFSSGDMSPEVARYVLTLGFSADDKARVQELVERNQSDVLSPAEWDELYDYLKADAVLGTLQSKARRLLKRKPTKARPA